MAWNEKKKSKQKCKLTKKKNQQERKENIKWK